MNKLLSAGFVQLRKDKAFLLGLLFMFGVGLFSFITKYSELTKYGSNELFDDALFIFVLFSGGCGAVFSSLFIGTEYSDGTIRNKLIVGHTRSNMYFANLLVSIAVTLMMAAAFLLPYGALGAFLLKPAALPPLALVCYFLISILTMMAFASLFNMLSMLITKKSTTAVVCLLTFIGLVVAALMIKEMLDAPEFISSYSMSINGIEQMEPEPNPKYLKDTARAVYQFFYDLIPSGQGLQLSMKEAMHPVQMIIYSLCIIAVTSIGGTLAFKRKDIK